MQNLGQLGLRNGVGVCVWGVCGGVCVWGGSVCVCVCVLFCFVLFFFLHVFSVFFFFFFFFFFNSWPDLNLRLYPHNARFQFQKYKIFSFLEGTFPSNTPVCVQACNWHWRYANSSPNVEDGCPSLCSFGVIAVVKCLVDEL